MNCTPDLTKLIELRSKTDRQLIQFITRRIDAGLNYARLLADPAADIGWSSVESFQINATNAYAEVHALLPWVDDITRTERQRLESKLENLRELLDESTIHAEMRVQTACS